MALKLLIGTALLLGACSGNGTDGPDDDAGNGDAAPSGPYADFVRVPCAWMSRCQEIPALECARNAAASWSAMSDALNGLGDCLSTANDCTDFDNCIAGIDLTECTSSDDPVCGVSGCEGRAPMCTATRAARVCVAGTDYAVNCAAAAGEACVTQSVTGLFCGN